MSVNISENYFGLSFIKIVNYQNVLIQYFLGHIHTSMSHRKNAFDINSSYACLGSLFDLTKMIVSVVVPYPKSSTATLSLSLMDMIP